MFFRNALYTIITGDGIVKSVDGGNSWVPANQGLIASDGATLTVSGGKLYAATHETNYGTRGPSTSGIYRLADDGNSWLPIQTKMQSSNDTIGGINQLTISGETFYIVGQMGPGSAALPLESRGGPVDTAQTARFFGLAPVSCFRQNCLRQSSEGKTVPLG